MGPLQVIPDGLLGFFDLKTFGRAPSELSEVVSPSLELRDWYFQSRAEWYTNGSISVTSNGFYAAVTVPATEWWFVHHAATETVPFTTVHDYQVCIAWYDRNPSQLFLGELSKGSSSSAQLIPPMSRERNMWLPPGATLGFKFAGDSVGPFSTLFSCRFTRLSS